jgi:hypothetical protein
LFRGSFPYKWSKSGWNPEEGTASYLETPKAPGGHSKMQFTTFHDAAETMVEVMLGSGRDGKGGCWNVMSFFVDIWKIRDVEDLRKLVAHKRQNDPKDQYWLYVG